MNKQQEDKAINNYSIISLTLVVVGTSLLVLKPPYYFDLVVLFIAIVFGIVGLKKSKSE